MLRTCLVLLSLLVLSSTAHAGYVGQPFTVTAPPSLFGTAIGNVLNQSGLSTGYSAGQDFDAYLAGNPTHNNGPEANVYLTSSANTGLLNAWTFEFAGNVQIESVAIVNKDGSFGVSDFRLINGDTGEVILDSTLASQAIQPTVPFQTFTFANPVITSSILFVPDGNYGAGSLGIGEIIFEQVPEPTTIALWSLLGIGLVTFRRYRRK